MKYFLTHPNYVFPRISVWSFQKRNPGLPWLTESSILLLESWIKSSDIGYEWGSGRSTIWFASRSAKIISVESNNIWFEKISKVAKSENLISKIDYHHISCPFEDYEEINCHEYCDQILSYPDRTFDFILVDGLMRLKCLENSIKKVKIGGIIILDNSDRFLPNKYINTHTSIVEKRTTFRSEKWKNVYEHLMVNSREIATSNQIWDTRIFNIQA